METGAASTGGMLRQPPECEACFTGCGTFFGLGDEEYGGLSTTAI